MMKTTLKLMFLVMAAAGLCFGCDDENSEPKAPVAVRFELLNEAGEPTTTFKEGEDIIFDYRIVNPSEEVILLRFPKGFNYPNLFSVFQILPPNTEAPEGIISEIGQPHYPHIIINAIAYRRLQPKSETQIRMTWKGDMDNTKIFGQVTYRETPNLLPGEYFVEFEQSLLFANYRNMDLQFKRHFEVL